MFKNLFLGGAATVATLAFLVGQVKPPPVSRMETIRQGRNNTVLFLTNCEHGLSNVLVATTYTLLDRHPDVEVHYASFAPIARKLDKISEYARKKHPGSTRGVVFHEIPGPSLLTIMGQAGRPPSEVIHPPGYAGAGVVARVMPWFTSPWSWDDHLTLYETFLDVIDEVDPSLIVLDSSLRPAIDAARNRSRLHAFISPLTPVEIFALEQPYGAWLWKYPVMGSGIPFPIPWTRLLENLYINAGYYWAMLRMSHYAPTQQYRDSAGLNDVVSWFSLRNDDVPFFTQALPGASTPLDVIPQNVTLTGPIILSLSPAAEQAPELVAWLARNPTVLVNLGSLFSWSDAHASAMVAALAYTLNAHPELQILWKFIEASQEDGGPVSVEELMAPLRSFVDAGRLRVVKWLDVQPVSILETGHVVASVHHGGAGCYSEALGSGVPQIVLPQWLDHYSFARLAQDVGVGVWGCSQDSPYWTTDCLRDAFSTVLTNDAIKKTARHFGDIARSDPGEHVAARGIARLAASGYSS